MAVTEGLSQRRARELRRLVAGVLFVAIVTPRVALTMNAAWRADGLGRSLAVALPEMLPLVNEAVLLPVGLVGSWLLLFGLDRSKRLQTVVVALSALAFVFVVVGLERQWLGAVQFGVDWPALVIGAGLGLAVGALPQLPESRRTREFPVAAGALFYSVLLLGVVSLLDLYLLGGPVTAEGWLLPGVIPGPAPGTAAGAAVDLVAIGVFVGVVGTLVRYTDAREVAVVAGDGRDAAALVAGLLDETDPEYSGTVTAGDGTAVLEAQGAVDGGGDPAPLTGRVAVSFLPPRRFSRWVTVGVERHDPRDIDMAVLDTTERSAADAVVDRLVPGWLRRALRPEAVLAATKLRRADLVVFLVSTGAFDTGSGADDPDDFGAPSYLPAYRELSRQLGRRTDQLAVLFEAEAALSLYETTEGVAEAHLDDDRFRDWLRTDLLDLPGVAVVPLSNAAAEPGQLLANTAELRQELER